MRECDGCGAPADEAHIRQRIERLEMATRFRPIHIQVLLLGDAPPTRIEDYFYRPLCGGESRSSAAKDFFVEVMKAAASPQVPPQTKKRRSPNFSIVDFIWPTRWNARF